MATEAEREATYHCGIGSLLKAAYCREFTMLEKGKCKTAFPKFSMWYETLDNLQRMRVDRLLDEKYDYLNR
jgi:hypothetical protein